MSSPQNLTPPPLKARSPPCKNIKPPTGFGMLNSASTSTGVPTQLPNAANGMPVIYISKEIKITTTTSKPMGILPNLDTPILSPFGKPKNSTPTPCSLSSKKPAQNTSRPAPCITIILISGIQPITHGTAFKWAPKKISFNSGKTPPTKSASASV